MNSFKVKNALNKKLAIVLLLAFIIAVVSIVTQIRSQKERSITNIQHKLEFQLHQSEHILEEFYKDTSFLHSLSNNNSPDNKWLDVDIANQTGLFIYASDTNKQFKLQFWNSTKYFFNEDLLKLADSSYFTRDINGDFEVVVKSITVNGNLFKYVGVIPVYWHYFIENEYLKSHFNAHAISDNLIVIKDAPNAVSVKTANGKPLFYIEYSSLIVKDSIDLFTSILRFTSFLLLILAMYIYCAEYIVIRGFKKSFILFWVLILVSRIILYTLPSLFYNKEMTLFDPTIYGSNFLHPSLGQLLINVFLVAVIVHFYNSYGKGKIIILVPVNKWVDILLKSFGLMIVGGIFISVINHLILDSKISFDISNFSNLDYLSLIGFLIIVILIISFSQLFIILFNTTIIKRWPYKQVSFYMGLMLLVTSIVSLLIIHQNQSVETEQRKKIAESVSSQDEEFGDNLIQIAISNFNESILKNNYKRFFSEKANKYIKDSIIAADFRGYLNKYDTHLYIYDSLHRGLYNDDTLQYNSLKEIITCNSSYEGFEGLYSFQDKEFSKNYIFQKNLISNKDTSLFVFILARPKLNYGNAIFPELFKQSNNGSSEKSNNYFYGIYVNNNLEKHFGNTPFPNKIPNNVVLKQGAFYQDITADGMNEMWYKASSNKTVVIARKNDKIYNILTLFSYLLCIAILVNFILKLIDIVLWKLFPAIKPFTDEDLKFHFQVQIQNAISIISIVGLLIIGVFTVSLFARRFQSNNNDRLAKSIQSIVEEVETEVQSKLIYNDASNIHLLKEMEYIDKKIIQISEIHSVDINLYDAEGNLKLSTQPYIFNKHLLNDKIDPLVFLNLKNNNYPSYINAEKIGLLPYQSIYAVIRDENKQMIGVIDIPYLNAQTELNAEVSNFLSTLINLNTFIFLFAGAISFLVSRRITSSLVLIGNKMKDISLGNVNEPIHWDKNDEIGVLVKEYNKMLQQLDISAKSLAKNEREIAWREMAKQVAHEIKNPLTPMKLSLQYLHKAIDNGNNNTAELTKQVAITLIEQIDQLARIASDFSQFANIQNANAERFDLINSIDSVVNLYKMDTNIQFIWTKPFNSCFVWADKTQINRVISNLIKNATESYFENGIKEVAIHCVVNTTNVVVSIIDKGQGIGDELKEKIFEPNFTTKTSGTGLGLAICKSIIENANGKIYFESIKNKTTTFFIELPVWVNRNQ